MFLNVFCDVFWNVFLDLFWDVFYEMFWDVFWEVFGKVINAVTICFCVHENVAKPALLI